MSGWLVESMVFMGSSWRSPWGSFRLAGVVVGCSAGLATVIAVASSNVSYQGNS